MRVCVYSIRTEDADNYVHSDFIKLACMTIDLRVAKLDTFEKEIVIFDFKNASTKHITEVLPSWKIGLESILVSCCFK